MHMDPLLPQIVGAAFAILLVGLISRKLRQPHAVAYLAVGSLLGPHGLALLANEQMLARFGEIGVVLLLFFVGMEVSVPHLIDNWSISVVGTILQIIISIACVFLLGFFMEWSLPRIISIGFAGSSISRR